MVNTNSIQNKLSRKSFTKKVLNFFYNTGLIRLGRNLFPNSLTVLNYHRINEVEDNPEILQSNISATVQGFDEQMSYMARWYNLVSLQQVTNWLRDNKPLPHHAALITFDDGYLDNYTNALPILKKYNFPAVIYLATGYIASRRPFYWDLAAYCFYHTAKDSLRLPTNHEKTWSTPQERDMVLYDLIEYLKKISETEKNKWLENLPLALDVNIPENYYQNMMLNWEQIREMRTYGIEFGAHTVTHPILTRVSLEQAQKEMYESKLKIEQELAEPVTSIAYPNGSTNDFNNHIIQLAETCKYTSAFTLLNGPASLSEVKREPHRIRRIFISHRHSMAHFSTLLTPLNRFRN